MAEKKKVNRIMEGLLDWTGKDNRLREAFGNGVANSRDYLGAKRDFFRDLYKTSAINPTAEEKVMRTVLQGEIRKLEKRLYPNVAVRLVAKLGEGIKEWLQTSRRELSGSGEMTVIRSKGKDAGYKNTAEKRTDLQESQGQQNAVYRRQPIAMKKKKADTEVSAKTSDTLLPKRRRNPNNGYGVH
ncbi:MAG: hypothetical protein INR73_26960 [Williamsia sp.]|nr:hypothetical protein [Williamsia sp.]